MLNFEGSWDSFQGFQKRLENFGIVSIRAFRLYQGTSVVKEPCNHKKHTLMVSKHDALLSTVMFPLLEIFVTTRF